MSGETRREEEGGGKGKKTKTHKGNGKDLNLR
jgi:hypothetical protein